MNFITSKTGIATILLIGAFAFALAGMQGVFGSTTLGLTLFSNAALNDGLVGHWTFDSTDVSGYTVSDRSGNGNDGVIVATTSASTEVLVDDTSGSSGTGFVTTGNGMVWVSDQEGYFIYADATQIGTLASTSDGGSTWGRQTAFDYPGSPVLWYDQWTPGDSSGTLIHMLNQDWGNEQVEYSVYDTNTGSLTSEVVIHYSGFNLSAGDHVALTKAEDGVLYALFPEASGSYMWTCPRNCTTSSSWSTSTSPFPADGNDFPNLLPLKDTNNVLLVYYDHGSDVIKTNVWSATSTSWWGETTIVSSVEETDMGARVLHAALNKNTGDVYLTYIDDANNYTSGQEDHDIDMWKFERDTYTWTELPNVITNASGGLRATRIVVDENRENVLYNLYMRLSTIDDGTTENIYYRVSFDEGQTWSNEKGPINTTEDNLQGISVSQSTAHKVGVFWQYDSLEDVYYADIADIGDYADEKTVPGNIGQGMQFDGVDDVIELPSNTYVASNTPFTISFWSDLDDLSGTSDEFPGAIRLETDQGEGFIIWHHDAGSYDGINFGSNIDFIEQRSDGLPNGYLNGWHHVTLTYDAIDKFAGSSYALYVDGSEISTIAAGSFAAVPNTSRIGIGSSDTSYFDGSLDDVRIYNRELSASEVSRLYELGATTKVNKTLTSNPDLENGLVGHWTFDATDVSGFTVRDRSSSGNNGVIIATSSPVETLIDPDGRTAGVDYEHPGPRHVWLSDDVGYMVYLDQSLHIKYASTTDGGSSWATTTVYGTGFNLMPSVWYDGWTTGQETGGKIHIVFNAATPDDLFYAYIDTADGSVSTPVNATDALGFSQTLGTNPNGITVAEDGTIYIASGGAGSDNIVAYCSSDCTSASSWSEAADAFNGVLASHQSMLVPVKGTNNIMVVWHYPGVVDVLSQIWSATSSSWWGAVIFEPTPNSALADSRGISYNKNTGDIYYINSHETNDYVTEDHDLELWKWEADTEMWSQLTNPVTNASGGLISSKIAVDQNKEGHLYVVYQRLTTITDIATGNIYYRYSTDDGSTWSSEIGPLNGTTDEEISGLGINSIPSHKLSVHYKYEDAPNEEDVYHLTVHDLGEYVEDLLIPGNIGQGIQLDGVDDYVSASSSYRTHFSNDFTVTAWVKSPLPVGANGTIWSTYDGSGDMSFAAEVTQGNGINFRDNSVELQTTTVGPDVADEWVHVAWVRDDSGVATIYQDGVSIVSRSDFVSGTVSLVNNDHLRFGRAGTGSYGEGMIDDFRIYNRALGTSTIERIYQLGATTKINKTITTNPDLESGLVGHWTFDGKDMDIASNTAEVLDRSGNGNTGDWIDHATTTTFGKMGQAINLDGVDDYVNISDNAIFDTGSTITIAAWVRWDVLSASYQPFFVKRAVGTSRIDFGHGGNTLWLTYTSSGVSRTGCEFDVSSYIFARKWAHIVFVGDSSGCKGYIDGVLRVSDSVVGDFDIEADINIGNRIEKSDSNFYFDGSVDDVRVYNRALSAEEITRLYQLGE